MNTYHPPITPIPKLTIKASDDAVSFYGHGKDVEEEACLVKGVQRMTAPK